MLRKETLLERVKLKQFVAPVKQFGLPVPLTVNAEQLDGKFYLAYLSNDIPSILITRSRQADLAQVPIKLNMEHRCFILSYEFVEQIWKRTKIGNGMPTLFFDVYRCSSEKLVHQITFEPIESTDETSHLEFQEFEHNNWTTDLEKYIASAPLSVITIKYYHQEYSWLYQLVGART